MTAHPELARARERGEARALGARQRTRGVRRRRAAFTLAEVLLALALVGAVAASIVGFVLGVASRQAQLADHAEQLRQCDAAIDALEAALATCHAGSEARPGVRGDADRLLVSSRAVDWPALLAGRPGSDAATIELLVDGGVLVVRTGAESPAPAREAPTPPAVGPSAARADARRAEPPDESPDPPRDDGPPAATPAPSPAPGPARGAAAGRGATPPPLGTDEREAPAARDAGPRELRLGRIGTVRFRYYDGREWRDSFDSAALGQLPVAVEIRLWLGAPDAPDPGLEPDPASLAATVESAEVDDGMKDRVPRPSLDPATGARLPDRVRVIAVPDGGAE